MSGFRETLEDFYGFHKLARIPDSHARRMEFEEDCIRCTWCQAVHFFGFELEDVLPDDVYLVRFVRVQAEIFQNEPVENYRCLLKEEIPCQMPLKRLTRPPSVSIADERYTLARPLFAGPPEQDGAAP